MGRENRRSSAKDIRAPHLAAIVSQLFPDRCSFFVKSLSQHQKRQPVSGNSFPPAVTQPESAANLLQSEVSMADIHPFRAFRYVSDPQRVSPAQVVTQPYDKITPALQDRYYAASPYNLVRIILGRREADDNPANNVYSRAAKSFRDWRQQGILRQDSVPSLYAYSQRFTPPGSSTEMERRGFIALGRIEDYSAGVVFRHEQT